MIKLNDPPVELNGKKRIFYGAINMEALMEV